MSAQQQLLGTSSSNCLALGASKHKQARVWQRDPAGSVGPTTTKHTLTQCNEYHQCCYTGHHKQSNLQGTGSISAARRSNTLAAHVLAGSEGSGAKGSLPQWI